MPLMNAFEFLEAYEQFVAPTQRFPIPVVMFTSSNDPADRKRALSHPCVKEYVVKPLRVEAASALVERFGLEP
jgi:CheY-like chemotaxis protein